jgi:hypothetical protein
MSTALTLDDVVVDPRRLGYMANLVHTAVVNEPAPKAARFVGEFVGGRIL